MAISVLGKSLIKNMLQVNKSVHLSTAYETRTEGEVKQLAKLDNDQQIEGNKSTTEKSKAETPSLVLTDGESRRKSGWRQKEPSRREWQYVGGYPVSRLRSAEYWRRVMVHPSAASCFSLSASSAIHRNVRLPPRPCHGMHA